MGRRPDFAPAHTSAGWMVSVPPAMSATGKRVRRFFADEKKAEKFAGKIRGAHTAGMRGGLIPAELALEAAAAMKVLAPLGISLIEAARMAAAAGGAKGTAGKGAETLWTRWRRVMKQGEEGWSERYRRDMGKIPDWVGKDLMGRHCREVSKDPLDAALRAHGAAAVSTLVMRRTRVLAVLNWREERAPRRAKDIRILTPTECGRVLRAAQTPEQRRVLGLLLFAGIRPDAEFGEISRLEWEAVGKTEVYLSPAVSKVGDRHVPITGRLRRLLRGHPTEGPVMPAGWRRAWQRIRREAGISEMQDVLRHTFASNFLAAFGEDATKQAMGHTAKSATLFRHYRRAVTEEAGKKFFR